MEALNGKKVFVLDPSTFFREAIKAEMEKLGALVETGQTSDAALMQIIRWHPDLLITGVVVGQITGYDLCLILKLMPEHAGIPVFIMSSNEKDIALRQAADAGADHYVQKDSKLIANLARLACQVIGAEVQASTRDQSRKAIRRALVVDDSRVMRKVISNILRTGLGIETILEAEHGVEGLERLKESDVDLIVSDWNMPKMNGLEFVRHVRENRKYNAIPIAMVTTEGGKKEVAEARAAGADAHLCKPFSVQAMKDMIARL